MAWQRRRYPRYKVAHLTQLTATMDRDDRVEEKILTVGAGGCSFYGFKADPKLRIGKNVRCSFVMEGLSAIHIPGDLIYAKPTEVGGRSVILYGVEFLESYKNLLRPLLQKLQELADQKLVQVVYPTDETEV